MAGWGKHSVQQRVAASEARRRRHGSRLPRAAPQMQLQLQPQRRSFTSVRRWLACMLLQLWCAFEAARTAAAKERRERRSRRAQLAARRRRR